MPASCPRCLSAVPQQAYFCPLCGAKVQDAPATTDAYPDPLVGQVVADRYRIVALVGRGGMGAVYRAEHVAIGKPVALKILHGTLGQRKEVLRRFRREAEASSRLTHIHTVQVFDYGSWRGLTYLVMEYLRGQDLATVIRREGRLPWSRTLPIVVQICESLAEAHSLGIVHRDLKPENVILIPRPGQPDFVKVVDFGLAKVRDEPGAQLDVTGDGSLLGTPFYMAPEQIRGEAVDGRTDVYAIGGLLYRCLTGLPPFEATTPFAVLTRHLSDTLTAPSLRAPDAGIPPTMDDIVLRAMAKTPADRYASADELRLALLDAAGTLTSIPASQPSLPAITLGLTPSTGRTPAAPPAAAPAAPPVAPSAPARSLVSARVEPGPSRDDLSRDEFERYLRRLRARRWTGLLVLLLLAAAAAAAVAVPRYLLSPPGPVSEEAEHNDSLVAANLVALDGPVTGTIGARVSEVQGDHDYYRLEIRPLRAGVLQAELTEIRGLDLRLDLFEASGGTPIAEANRGGPGEPERILGVRVDGMVYFVRVSESLPDETSVPTERPSDRYALTLRLLPAESYEGEPNDDPATAEGMSPGMTRTGWIEVEHDRDVYCLTAIPPEGAWLRAVSTSKDALDLALEAGDRLVNAAGSSGGEQVLLDAATPCAAVRLAPGASIAGIGSAYAATVSTEPGGGE